MSEGHGTGAGRTIIYRGDDPQEYILQLERALTAEREKIACIGMDRDHARLDAKTERERAALAEARAYSRGLQLGWNLGVSNDNDGFNRALSDARAEVQAIDAARRK